MVSSMTHSDILAGENYPFSMYKHLKYKIQSANSMTCLFKHERMKYLEEIDVCNSDGERHEKDEVRVTTVRSL